MQKKVAMYRQNMKTTKYCIVCSVGVFVTFRITQTHVNPFKLVREKRMMKVISSPHITHPSYKNKTNSYKEIKTLRFKEKKCASMMLFVVFYSKKIKARRPSKKLRKQEQQPAHRRWWEMNVFLMFDFLLYLIWVKIRFSFLKKIHTYKLIFFFM